MVQGEQVVVREVMDQQLDHKLEHQEQLIPEVEVVELDLDLVVTLHLGDLAVQV